MLPVYFKKSCRICNKPITQKNKKIRLIHRNCWLKNRTFTQKQFDFLFCNEKKFGNNFTIIKPTFEI